MPVVPWSMTAEPAPEPRWIHVLPESSVAQRPFFEMPTMTRAESGFAETSVTSPPPAAWVMSVPVTLVHSVAGATTTLEPPAPPAPALDPPAPVPPDPPPPVPPVVLATPAPPVVLDAPAAPAVLVSLPALLAPL